MGNCIAQRASARRVAPATTAAPITDHGLRGFYFVVATTHPQGRARVAGMTWCRERYVEHAVTGTRLVHTMGHVINVANYDDIHMLLRHNGAPRACRLVRASDDQICLYMRDNHIETGYMLSKRSEAPPLQDGWCATMPAITHAFEITCK